MRWICRRSNNQAAVWIAIAVVLMSSHRNAQHSHSSAWWLVGLSVGAVTAAVVLVWRKRCV